jgi:GNAT superfamily N-acetyltransferase
MSSSVTIRRAASKDVEALTRLCGALGYPADDAATAARFGALEHSSTDIVLVAEKEGAVIGWIQAHAAWVLESGFRVQIVGLVVEPHVRRSGAGRALVAAAEQWAKDLGSASIVVQSNVQRVESHAFYPALGYVRRKTQEVYGKALMKHDSVTRPAPARAQTATTLVPMTEAEYAAYAELNTREYAAEKVASGEWSVEESLRLARESYEKLLPQGLGTPGQHFYTVRASGTHEDLGVLWFGIKERAGKHVAYVYAISIHERHRRKGHATRAFAALEEKARALGLAGIQLHVFGHNPAAQVLYAKIGFKETNVFMFKELGGAASREVSGR